MSEQDTPPLDNLAAESFGNPSFGQEQAHILSTVSAATGPQVWADMCGCDRPDMAEDPCRHPLNHTCLYWATHNMEDT